MTLRVSTLSVSRLMQLPQKLEALAWLTLAWLLIDGLPGDRYRWVLPAPKGTGVLPKEQAPVARSTNNQVQQIARDIQLVRQRMPFRCVCLHQAIAAYHMLRRRGFHPVLHLGMLPFCSSETLSAHAWVSCAGTIVTGGDALENVHEIAVFRR